MNETFATYTIRSTTGQWLLDSSSCIAKEQDSRIVKDYKPQDLNFHFLKLNSVLLVTLWFSCVSEKVINFAHIASLITLQLKIWKRKCAIAASLEKENRTQTPISFI